MSCQKHSQVSALEHCNRNRVGVALCSLKHFLMGGLPLAGFGNTRVGVLPNWGGGTEPSPPSHVSVLDIPPPSQPACKCLVPALSSTTGAFFTYPGSHFIWV